MANARHQGYSHTMEQLSRRQHMPPPHGQGTECLCVSLSFSLTHTVIHTHTPRNTHTSHKGATPSSPAEAAFALFKGTTHTRARVRTSSGVF